jgi:hypothetical protein
VLGGDVDLAAAGSRSKNSPVELPATQLLKVTGPNSGRMLEAGVNGGHD